MVVDVTLTALLDRLGLDDGVNSITGLLKRSHWNLIIFVTSSRCTQVRKSLHLLMPLLTPIPR